MANESDRSDKATVGRVFAKSALGTVNLVVAGAAAVGAAALHSVPVLALGGVAYAALGAWDLVTPAFWRKARAPEAVEADCTVKRGGVLRLKILEDLTCEPGDVLILELEQK